MFWKRVVMACVIGLLLLSCLAVGSGCKAEYEEFDGYINANGDCVKGEPQECHGRALKVSLENETAR
jgi:hypothetical protein